MAGDEWFLDSLTKTGLIADFEQKSGIHVEVVHKNDRTIMSDLDRGPNRGDTLDVIVVRHRLLGALVKKNRFSRSILFSPTPPCTTPASCRRSNFSPTGGGNSAPTEAGRTGILSPA
jgi:hypothetical protein